MDAAANETPSPKKSHQQTFLNLASTDLDASQKSRLTLSTSSSNTSSSNHKKKFVLDNDDLYYEGNRVYKDDLDSEKASTVNGSVKHANKVKLSNEYDGLMIERKPNSVSFIWMLFY
jgi:hypothetical protein